LKGGYEEFGSRSKIRAKRRKTNLILNTLIGIVLLLIFIVSFNIFFAGDDEKAAGNHEQRTENHQEKNDGTVSKSKKNKDQADDEEIREESSSEQELEELSDEEETGDDEESEPIVTPGGSSPDVKATIVNPDWKPIGTTQTGEHPTAVYDESSVDWQEMLQAISYATGIEQSNMTVWFLGNNGPNKSVGTISSKIDKQKYKVYIEWVDGEGWKPVKVEELQS
jgi:cytoskeletal protein RodZ